MISKIYVCSPFRGDVDNNIKKARQWCRQIAMNGDIPIAPHLYFTQFLDDDNPKERELAFIYNAKILEKCNELWICGDTISDGMHEEIQLAIKLGLIIRRLW